MNEATFVVKTHPIVKQLNDMGIVASTNWPSRQLLVFDEIVAVVLDESQPLYRWGIGPCRNAKEAVSAIVKALDNQLGAYLTVKSDLAQSGLLIYDCIASHLRASMVVKNGENLIKINSAGRKLVFLRNIEDAERLVESDLWGRMKRSCEPGCKPSKESLDLIERFKSWKARRKKRKKGKEETTAMDHPRSPPG